jgi:asparagine synthase (glutamine-hydrolysing)
MPGIIGIIGKPGHPDLGPELVQMTSTMLHEKWYRQYSVQLPQQGVWLGWVGHPGSYSDCMPVYNDAKSILLVMTGELFPPSDGAGPFTHPLANRSNNLSWIISLYEQYGEAFVSRLNGTFAGIIVDQRTAKTLLFNDRFGLSRVYYHEGADAIRFASEAKALLAVCDSTRELERRALVEFLGWGCALENRTLFRNVHQLPAASLWTFDRERVNQREYFSTEDWEAQEPLEPGPFIRAYEECLATTVPKYFAGIGHVAASLTGGLDSRLVAAWAPQMPFLIPCYTFSGMYHPCRDAVLGEQVARKWQQHHHVLRLDKAFLTEFPALAKRAVYCSDGAQDVTGSATLYMNRLARGIAPIRVTANYGNEVLRENRVLRFDPDHVGFAPPDLQAAVRASNERALSRPESPLSYILRRQVPWHHYGRLAVEQTQVAVRTPFLDNAIVGLQYRCPAHLRQSIDFALTLIAAGNPELCRFPTDRGHSGTRRRLWRRPREWWEAALTRADYFFDYGMPQFAVGRVDRFFGIDVGRQFLGRHKYYHFRRWYANELSTYVKDVLLDTRALGRPYVDRRAVERMVTSHTSGSRNYTLELHKLLTLELLHRQLIDPPTRSPSGEGRASRSRQSTPSFTL